MSDLDTLLEVDDVALEAGLGAERRSGIGPGSGGPAGFLQVCTLLENLCEVCGISPRSFDPRTYLNEVPARPISAGVETVLCFIALRLEFVPHSNS
jgi:hypothetical protein